MSVIEINSVEQLEELIDKSNKLVVKLSTTTCSPCKSYNPIFQSFSDQNPDISTASIILDTQPELMTYAKNVLGLTSVPVTIVYLNKAILKRFNGIKNLYDLNHLYD